MQLTNPGPGVPAADVERLAALLQTEAQPWNIEYPNFISSLKATLKQGSILGLHTFVRRF